jgi:hypothetical protein
LGWNTAAFSEIALPAPETLDSRVVSPHPGIMKNTALAQPNVTKFTLKVWNQVIMI